MSVETRRALIEEDDAELSIRRQCQILDLCRSSYYYQPARESEENLRLMGLVDRLYTNCPFYGSRKMTAALNNQNEHVNRKRVRRLMQLMGLEALYPKP